MAPSDDLTEFVAALGHFSDAELATLFGLRPDLIAPPPNSFTVLANRALGSGSLSTVGDTLTILDLAVLETILAATSRHERITAADITTHLAARAADTDIAAALTGLRERALVWPQDGAITTVLAVSAALPTLTWQHIAPLATRPLADISSAVANLDGPARDLVTALATGSSAVGRTRGAAPDADPDHPVARLLASGLLLRHDDQTVELPTVVGQLLRGEHPREPRELTPPAAAQPTHRFSPEALDSTGGGAAQELLRDCESLLDELGTSPAHALRNGGIGVRDVRRVARVLGTPEQRAAMLLEICEAAGLLDVGMPPGTGWGEPVWAPTAAYDRWLLLSAARRWLEVVRGWVTMSRRPWTVGETAPDGSKRNLLTTEFSSARAVAERRHALTALGAAAPHSLVDRDVALHWVAFAAPRWLRVSERLMSQTLTAATELGLIAHDCITTVGHLVAGISFTDEAAVAALVDAMGAALPAPIDFFLLQADLTLTAPGPLEPELAQEVSLLAELESAGSASVYRITETSLRRALDAGRSATEIIGTLTNHSKTPVPQGLEYLVTDVARRHGQLRIGATRAFVRCEDPALLAEILGSPRTAGAQLRAVAPTVAVSTQELSTVLETLREAGFAPAGEDDEGTLIDLREPGTRVERRRSNPPAPRPSAPRTDQLAQVVTTLRAFSDAEKTGARGDDIREVLAAAVRDGNRVRLTHVNANGGRQTVEGVPVRLSAGMLVVSGDGGESISVALPRITTAQFA